MPRLSSRRLAGPSLLAALIALGCGSAERHVPVYPVKGSVKVNGKPAAKAAVTFHPLSGDAKAPSPTGEVAEDGTFVLGTYSANDGAPAGKYAVTVRWPTGSSPIGGDADEEDKLGRRYSDPTTSGLKAPSPPAPPTSPRSS